MKKIVFFAKTDLNTDGRILNQLKLLQEYKKDLSIDFILLPDKPLRINPGTNVKMHLIDLPLRHNRVLRSLTVALFTWKALRLLFMLKPAILHAQDSSSVIPALIYKKIKGKKVHLIYDDHEMPNENDNLTTRLLNSLELKLIRAADLVLFANEERLILLKEKYGLKNKLDFFLNLPYFSEGNPSAKKQSLAMNELLQLQSSDYKFLIHQGVIAKERGREKLARFSKTLPPNYKIILLGGNEKDFNFFLQEYSLDPSNFYFVGTVDYWELNQFWELGTASIIMYLPTYSNNKYCAPNRFYLSVSLGIPTIVNEDNPVLKNLTQDLQCGYFIESINLEAVNLSAIDHSQIKEHYNVLKMEEIEKFLSHYKESY